MSPYQLGAICYCGDLYHIRIFNDQFMRTFINKMIQPVLKEDRRPEIVNEIYGFDEATLYYTHYVLSDYVKGRGKDYAKMNEDGIAGVKTDKPADEKPKRAKRTIRKTTKKAEEETTVEEELKTNPFLKGI
jgi:hypothetical protein